MIINPIVGMRVRGRIDAQDSAVINKVGCIRQVMSVAGFNFLVEWDIDVPFVGNTWWCHATDMDPELISPEEQTHQEDQLRRLKHAMQYL